MLLSKKSAAVAAVVLSVGLLAACSNGSSGNSEGSGNGTLRVGVVQNDKAAVEAIIAEFKKTNPDVKFDIVTADTNAYQTTLRTQLSANTGPDVFFMWPGAGNPGGQELLVKAGYLKDLSGSDWTGKIPSALDEVLKVKGKVYDLPMTMGGIGAIYNMDAMKEQGLSAPTTWPELLGFCSAAKAKGVSAFALGGATASNNQLIDYALTSTTVYSKNKAFNQDMADGKATFAGSEGWKTAMAKNIQMRDAGCFQDNPLGVTYDAATTLVASGKAMAIVQTQGAIGQLDAKKSGGNFVMQPLPATDNASDTWMASSVGTIFGINAKTQNAKLADKFLNFMYDQRALYAKTAKALPLIETSDFVAPESTKAITEHQKDGKTSLYPDARWPNAKVQQTHLAVMQELFGDKTSVENALSQMDAAYKG